MYPSKYSIDMTYDSTTVIINEKIGWINWIQHVAIKKGKLTLYTKEAHDVAEKILKDSFVS